LIPSFSRLHSNAAASSEVHYEADQEGDQENKEQDLGYTGRRKRDSAEAQQTGYQRNY
jgi:hypothetical protein